MHCKAVVAIAVLFIISTSTMNTYNHVVTVIVITLIAVDSSTVCDCDDGYCDFHYQVITIFAVIIKIMILILMITSFMITIVLDLLYYSFNVVVCQLLLKFLVVFCSLAFVYRFEMLKRKTRQSLQAEPPAKLQAGTGATPQSLWFRLVCFGLLCSPRE